MIKGVRLNTMFKTTYVVINYNGKKKCIKNCRDWVAVDKDKNEIIVDNLGNIIFFNSKLIVEQTGDIYKNRISISNLKGIDNLINIK